MTISKDMCYCVIVASTLPYTALPSRQPEGSLRMRVPNGCLRRVKYVKKEEKKRTEKKDKNDVKYTEVIVYIKKVPQLSNS